MSTLHTAKRPVLDTYRYYRNEIVPRLDKAIAATGKTERDDDSADGGKPRDELSAQGYIVCGAFALRAATAPINVYDSKGEAVLRQNERFMGIHLLETTPEDATIGHARQSLKEAATYLRSNDLEGNQLGSVTYARLGEVAQKAFGFEMDELPITTEPLDDPLSRPVFVHMPVQEFIERY